MNSMTGFGRGVSTCEEIEFSLELSSVNRRNLEMSCSIPKEWYSVAESAFMSLLKEKAFRGKFHVSLQYENKKGCDELSWDDDAVKQSVSKLKNLSESLGLPFQLDTDTLIRVASMHRKTAQLAGIDEVLPSLRMAFSEALDNLIMMREKEGEQLRLDLLERIVCMEGLLNSIKASSEGRVDNYRELLMLRLKNAGLELELEDERVLKEVSIFADRCDIAEEFTRLESHLLQTRETLSKNESGPIGRKLEFILQEINREFNTIGAKANNIDISKAVIEAKNEIERVREQLQNVE